MDISDESLDNWLLSHPSLDTGHILTDGEIVDGYEICCFLGKGGSGEVYRAKHCHLQTTAAIKMLHRNTPEAAERFKREATLLMTKPHRSFPKFFGFGKYKGYLYIVIEELEPRPLPSKDKDVADFLFKLCDGICYLHSLGYVHRDIKPSNILFRADGTPVIIDLGLVKKVKPAQPEGVSETSTISIVDGKIATVGTPQFSAPEQFIGEEVTFAADIHALGALIHTCFNGEAPRSWRPILRRATSSIIRERYKDIAQFVHAVKARNARRFVPYVYASVIAAVGTAAWLIAAKVYSPDIKLESAYRQWNLVAAAIGNGTVKVSLAGQLLHIDTPVTLDKNERIVIEGPGCMEVEFRGTPRATVILRHCTVINSTKDANPSHSPHFILEKGSYLNFSQLSEGDESDFAEPYDLKNSAIRFGGPTFTLRGLF